MQIYSNRQKMGKYKGKKKKIVLFNILGCGLNRLAAGLNSASQITVLAVVGMKKGKMI